MDNTHATESARDPKNNAQAARNQRFEEERDTTPRVSTHIRLGAFKSADNDKHIYHYWT